jgi:hypothetical protein
MDRIGANNFITALLTLPTHLLVAAGLLAALVLSFLTFFLIPAITHWFRLRHLQAGIGALPGRTPPGEFRRLFAADSRLAHLWKEYQDSLHVQREVRDGQMQAVAVRSTLPAETFFNSQYVVDARLRTEFFKHLPGIFTGIGIIGTFTGLIEGLRQFQVSENAATVRASLESLMHSVGEAFLISASAIAAAMIVTFLEKLLLASLYGRTEEIAHSIDARFDAGAGEDYLSRLVKASEDSASQAKTLKDALVQELADVMRESTGAQISALRDQQALAAQQIEETSRKRMEAARQDADRLGSTISDSIEKSLRAPLEAIANIVQTASGDQSARASQMLQEVMARFSERLDALFGGQVAGITELNRQTAEALQTTLATAGQQISDVLAAMSDSQRHVLDGNRDREQAMVERTSSAMGTMSETVEQALKEMSDASAQMSNSVQALTKTTTTSLDKMNAGAAQLESASRSFAAAGERVSGVMGQASDVSLKLVQASSSLSAGATTMQDGLGDYRAQREAVGHVVSELRATVELARKEASLTADVLSRIEGSAERLSDAQKQADQYLSGVSKVLGDAHQAFATSVKKTLELANTEFHTKLATAVGLLSSTIGELEATIGNVAPQRH